MPFNDVPQLLVSFLSVMPGGLAQCQLDLSAKIAFHYFMMKVYTHTA